MNYADRYLRDSLSFRFAWLFFFFGLISWGSLAAQTPSARAGMGPIPYEGGVAFRVWAPNAEYVSVVGPWNSWNPQSNPLAREGSGDYTWSADVAGIGTGALYKYYIEWNGQQLWRKDPRSTQVENSSPGAASIVADLDYDWQHSFQMPGWNELVLYQMHIGTFYDSPGFGPGNFPSATAKLDHLADLGVNMIALMPVFEFAGDFSRGYNPAYLYAPESAYGTPEQLMHFIDEAHARGIGVMMDMVHNHWGPSDMDMWQFDGPGFGTAPANGGIYFYTDWRAETPWGHTRPDYGRGQVRSFIKDNVFFWLDSYRTDGIRWDSTGNIYATENGNGPEIGDGREMLKWINGEVNALQGWKPMIAEDFAKGDWVTQDLASAGLGFDAQWAGAFVHPMRDTVIPAEDSSRNMWTVASAIGQNYNGQAFRRVIYTESHDENANGRARLPEEIWPGNAGSYYSRKRSTLAAVVLMTSPGIPMIFQGQEILEDEWFRDEDPIDWQKQVTYAGIYRLYRDIIRLRRNWYDNTRGLRGPSLNIFHINNDGKVIAYHRWDQGGSGDDVVIVANFSGTTYNEYFLGFPRSGTWHTIFNSDSTSYSNDYSNVGPPAIDANGGGMDGLGQSGNISIGPYSVLIFSQKQNPPAQSESEVLMFY